MQNADSLMKMLREVLLRASGDMRSKEIVDFISKGVGDDKV